MNWIKDLLLPLAAESVFHATWTFKDAQTAGLLKPEANVEEMRASVMQHARQVLSDNLKPGE